MSNTNKHLRLDDMESARTAKLGNPFSPLAEAFCCTSKESMRQILGATLFFVVLTFFIVVFGLTTDIIQLRVDGALAVSSPKCDDGNQCTFDKLSGVAGYCEHLPYSTDKTCTSACYVTDTVTKCDGIEGKCVAQGENAWISSKGYCATVEGEETNIRSGDCDTALLYPLRPYYLTTGVLAPSQYDKVNQTYSRYASDRGGTCLANQCKLNVLAVRFIAFDRTPSAPAYDYSWRSYASAEVPCIELLDNDTAANGIDTSCIVAEEIPLEATFLASYSNKQWGPSPAGNYSLRICQFSYASAQYNASAFYDDAFLSKRALYGYAPQPDVQALALNEHKRFAVEELLPRAMDLMEETGAYEVYVR